MSNLRPVSLPFLILINVRIEFYVCNNPQNRRTLWAVLDLDQNPHNDLKKQKCISLNIFAAGPNP